MWRYLAGAFFMCSPTKVALVMPISVLASEMTDRRCCVVTALDTPYVPLPTMSFRVSLTPAARDSCRSNDSWQQRRRAQNTGGGWRNWRGSQETIIEEDRATKTTFPLMAEDSGLP